MNIKQLRNNLVNRQSIQKHNRIIQVSKSILSVLLLVLLVMVPTDWNKNMTAAAATAAAISFGAIDYENLTLQVYDNNNDIVYYSTDNSNWEELDAAYNSSTNSYSMDISWVSATSDVTLYFKGDSVKTVKQITLPMQNTDFSVEYDKVEREFTFISVDAADYFEWRKITNYYWNKVDLTESSSSYQSFLNTIEGFRLKGIKIIVRIPQVPGTSALSVGARASTEITITIPAQVSAPLVKVNSSKLMLNTSTTMEYYDSSIDMWMECEANMSIADIAPSVLYENGAKAKTLLLRKAATTSAAYSKTQRLELPAQRSAPTIGGNTSDVTYYYMNGKLVLQFNNATKINLYEYSVVKSGFSYDMTKMSWKTVTSNSLITLTTSSVPDGATIYVRKKGTDENTSYNVALVLASAESSFTVAYPN